MDPFLELLAQLESDISALTVEELTEGREQIAAYGRELRDTADEAEDQEQLNTDALALAAAIARIDTELESRAATAVEAASARDEAFAAFADDGEGESGEAQASEEEEATEETEETETVVAAGPPLTEIARRRPRGPGPQPVETRALVASAVGAEGFGTPFPDSVAVAQAMWDAKRRGPTSGSVTVARMAIDNPGPALGAIAEDNWKVLVDLQRGVQQARQAGQGLVAAGFCAPAEPQYNFLGQDIASRDGVIELPSATARRGRITYPELFNVRDLQVQAGVAWEHTSTMDVDAVEKPCYTVPCGTGVTFDVNGYSTCLRYSNFDSQFWPERVTFSSGQAMIAHDHEVSLALINAIVADGRTTAVIDGHAGGGTWPQFIQSLALHGGFIRSRFRLPLSTILEAAVPSFVLDALVADQVARDSTTEYGMMQAEIEAAARRARVNVQWVYDWQELDHPNWPADYDYLIWPAGTVVRLSGGTLDLGITRDSTLNVANDFQQFVETFDGHAIIGPGVYSVTGVNLCPTGATGNREAISCAAGS